MEVFTMFKQLKAKKELNAIRAEIDANLKNNYRAPAQAARVKFGQRVDELYHDGVINLKTYKDYKLIYGEYCEKMEDFGH